MSNLVIVAIPEKDDPVWEMSSEPVPHLTLLYLGESSDAANLFQILQFLDHAASTVLHRFSLEIDRRDTLGPDKADVVFFHGWDLPEIKRFRGQLLQNDNINKAYLENDQFPEWLPHLTLGYPKAPAKKRTGMNSDRIYSVSFDRVALWVDDYAGPEFPLKRYEYPEVSMSAIAGKTAVEEILEQHKEESDSAVDAVLTHFGIKGMRWGRRKKDYTTTPVTVTKKPGGGVSTEGGKNQPSHPESVSTAVALRKAKSSGLRSLSNKELTDVATRLNLEQNVSRLAYDELASTGKKWVDLLLAVT